MRPLSGPPIERIAKGVFQGTKVTRVASPRVRTAFEHLLAHLHRRRCFDHAVGVLKRKARGIERKTDVIEKPSGDRKSVV